MISKIADVPRVDEKVDFVGSRVMDHRVKHYQMLWIVIDREPKGLNCRWASSGQLVPDNFDYSSILVSDVSDLAGDAIEIYVDQLWLRVDV